MKKTVLKFGLYSSLVILGLFSINLFTSISSLDMATQEIVGYLSMFIALIFVFFGIKSYRDNVGNGNLTFKRGLGLGVLISLIPSALFGIFDVIYITMIDPEFFQRYRDSYVADLETKFQGAELTAQVEEIDQMMTMAANPLFDFFLMFMTVFVLGFIVTLISAFILRRSTPATV